MSYPNHLHWFDYPNNVSWGVQIVNPTIPETSQNSCCCLSLTFCLYISRQPDYAEPKPVHWLTRVQITRLLTDGLFQGHWLYVGVLFVVHVGCILSFVVSGCKAVMITPYYQQEVQVHPWGHKNATKTKWVFGIQYTVVFFNLLAPEFYI
jgi:hypothetical protein